MMLYLGVDKSGFFYQTGVNIQSLFSNVKEKIQNVVDILIMQHNLWYVCSLSPLVYQPQNVLTCGQILVIFYSFLSDKFI